MIRFRNPKVLWEEMRKIKNSLHIREMKIPRNIDLDVLSTATHKNCQQLADDKDVAQDLVSPLFFGYLCFVVYSILLRKISSNQITIFTSSKLIALSEMRRKERQKMIRICYKLTNRCVAQASLINNWDSIAHRGEECRDGWIEAKNAGNALELYFASFCCPRIDPLIKNQCFQLCKYLWCACMCTFLLCNRRSLALVSGGFFMPIDNKAKIEKGLLIGMLHRRVFFINSIQFASNDFEKATKLQSSRANSFVHIAIDDRWAKSMESRSHNKISHTDCVAPSFCFYW